MSDGGKQAAPLWDEVQGACDLVRLEHALRVCADRGIAQDGWTPLHYVCENRSVANDARAGAIALLLRSGFRADAVDENGWSALHLLCKNRSEDGGDLGASLQSLLDGKADPNLRTLDGKKAPLHLLCENEAVTAAALQVLLKHKADANAVDEDGNSPLHYLGENASCSAVMIEALLAAKANPNTQNQFQSSATHYLLQNSAVSLGMVLALLQHKADLNVKNNIGNTPMHYLCENEAVSLAMLQAIMDAKRANVTISNSLGKLASDYIPITKQDCYAFLLKFAAPKLVAGATAKEAAAVGGEDPGELPPKLRTALEAWNASLPPFNAAFYLAISCEAAFEAAYEQLQDVSAQLCDAPSDAALFRAWEARLASWRGCVLLAYAALVPPGSWPQYAEQYARAVPPDLNKLLGKVEGAWKQFPDAAQRRERFQALGSLFDV